ncbi:acyl-ACP thioesterase domain-containing protein [Lactobacillaceae bacterium 24-114]
MELRRTAQEYEMPHQLTYYECDETGKPTLSMIMSMLSLVAEAHGESLGLDGKKIHSTGGAWVYGGFEGQLSLDDLHYGDQIILGTKGTAYNKYFATRDFWIRSLDGKKEYVRVRAMLVFMNLESRKIMAIPDELIEPYQSDYIIRIPHIKRPGKIGEDDEINIRQYHVRYFDLDINHHVNNARYFDWLLDPLGEKFLSSHQLTSFAIQYDREVRFDQDVVSEFCQVNDEKSLHQIISNGQECTLAEFSWAKNK